MANPDLSSLDSILRRLGVDPFARGIVIVQGAELASDAFPRLDTDRPALIFAVPPGTLAALAHTLQRNYPAGHPLVLLDRDQTRPVPLERLAQDAAITPDTVLYVPPLAYDSSPLTLANIMARLRAPVGGCPWDLEQTHASITRALVEETYEVIEAISDGDIPHLREELGDLLLHVLFQTQIARDDNEFALSDVGAELAAKLIRRHPHVFGDAQAKDAGVVLENWEKIKAEEKRQKGQAVQADALDTGIPRHLPALTRAQKVAERGRRKNVTPAANGVSADLAQALKRKRAPARERALGQVLLELAALAQAHGIDAERALNAATKEFVKKNRE